MYILLAIIILLIFSVIVFMQQPKFGKLPSGERLERIKKSPNYKNASFQNQSPTRIMTAKSFKDFITDKRIRVIPVDEIPTIKTNLINLSKNDDVLVWFGHSSYFMQIDGKKILVDPILNGYASPFPFAIKAFKGTDIYTTDDIPEIDCLLITHDHWDHMDYKTIKALKPKIKQVICGLGNGAHLEHWGYNKNIIFEMDWYEKINLDGGLIVNAIPARHFSGRTFRRNKTLWLSFVLQTNTFKIFFGGDGGYDKHFAETGNTFGSIDIAILDNGQHNKNWKYIHMMPDEILKTFNELKAKRLFAAHNSKFALATHAWDEPLIEAKTLSEENNIPLIYPMIGEKVSLKNDTKKFTEWWKNLR